MAVVIKTFQTPGGKYVYDRGTNSILSVSDEEFESCRRVENGIAQKKDWKTLLRYTEQGYLLESQIKEIVYPDGFQYELKSRVQQLTLQLTQNCNLRCSYCTYSGAYEYQRTHSGKTMSLSLIKKAVDFVMLRSREVKSLAIGFYGGEPLLEFENIRACITYIKENYEGRIINYTITTNGTIFNDEIAKFLTKNNFDVVISIDGPRELHNKNRVYQGGEGSFDDIMRNIEYIKKYHNKLFKRISFMTVVAPGTDFSCVNDFFDAETIISDRSVTSSLVNQFNSKEQVIYDNHYKVASYYQEMKVLFAALGLYPENKISKLFFRNLVQVERFHKKLSKGVLSGTTHPGGPCIPGALRLFVATDGTLYPCERVNESSYVMKIGHIDNGFDLEKIEILLNVGVLTKEECKVCWCFLHCTLCCAASDDGEKLSRAKRLENCESSKLNRLEDLRVTCLLLENGYDFDSKL